MEPSRETDPGFTGDGSPENTGGPATEHAVPVSAADEDASAGDSEVPRGSDKNDRRKTRRNKSGRVDKTRPTFLLTNINRLITPTGRTKSGFLADQAELKNAIFVAVTETWLHDGVLDSEVCHNFPGFSFIRSDRIGREGGGVALYLKEPLTGDILGSFDNKVCQFMVVKIHQLETVITVFYRPPDTRLAEFTEALQKLDMILAALPAPTPTVTVMGDLNLPKSAVQWIRGEEGHLVPLVANHRDGETAGGKQDRLQAQKLVDFATKHNLVQQVDVATHGVEILDLVLTNDDDLISDISVEEFREFTDHKIVTGILTYQTSEENQKEEQEFLLEIGQKLGELDFNKAPWKEIQSELENVDWDPVRELSRNDPAAGLAWFNDKVLSILVKLVPVRKRGKVRRHRMCRQRRTLWRRLSKIKEKIRSAENIQKLTRLIQERWELEKQLSEDYVATNNMEEDKAVFNMKSNPRSFFSFAKSRQKTKTRVGPFIDPATGKSNTSPEFASETLRQQYDSVFNPPRPEWVVTDVENHFQTVDDPAALQDIVFTEEDIEKACAELKSQSAGGADGVPAVLLKTCRKQLAKPLHYIWRSSLDHGMVPQDLLLVVICPVFKGGSRGVPKNYRPVALTSHVVKVFERVMRKSLIHYLEINNLLPDGQHGFRGLRSTLTQLLNYWDGIIDHLEEGGGVDSIYLDFSKAFDKVETGVLLHKLKRMNIRGKVGRWLASFLNSDHRKQAVVVNGKMSRLSPVVSGVPQGTVLGPVLFLIHISDIADGTSPEASTSSFADDTRIRRGIKHPETDCQALQEDLNVVYRWAEKVNMNFNADKFECLRFWPGSGNKPDIAYKGPDGTTIEEKQHLRDLGVEISSDLNFTVHIQNVITSSSKLAGWALRTFRRRSRSVMMTIWKCLVQPKMDYCSQLWSPVNQAAISQLEGVQRHFTSRVAGMEEKDYWERLQELKLYSQERRRERYQIIFLWKISQNLVKGYSIEFKEDNRRGRLAMQKPVKWHCPAAIKNARQSSLGVRGAKLFNILPKELRNISSQKADKFKSALDKFLSLVPDQPTIPGRGRAAETNSLLHQLPLLERNTN